MPALEYLDLSYNNIHVLTVLAPARALRGEQAPAFGVGAGHGGPQSMGSNRRATMRWQDGSSKASGFMSRM